MSLGNSEIRNELRDRIREAQAKDDVLLCMRGQLNFSESGDGVILFQCRICVPSDVALRKLILEESHKSKYSFRSGITKMYQDLKRMFWSKGMKRDIADFVSRCLTCQNVKVEHQRPLGPLQPLSIPEWKWECITIDFVTRLPRTLSSFGSIRIVVD
jgi:hypothetical protein